jgi:hypothetical protein
MADKKALTPEQRKKVQAQIAELQASLEDEAAASTPAEKEEASQDVEEEKQKTAELFDRLGLTEADFDLLAAAMASGTEERTRRIVREELAAEEEAAGDGSLAAAGEPGAQPVENPAPDDAPAPSKHWSEKKLWGKKHDEEEGE